MRGFTLLETTVAISILTVGILGPLSVATYALSRSSISENQIIAYNLAEEGLEFIINKRDSNVFAGNNWLQGIGGGSNCASGNGCTIDVIANTINNNCGGGCPVMRFDSNGKYNYSSGANSIFTREIYLRDVPGNPNPDEKILEVRVTWDERIPPQRKVIIFHHIYDRE